MDKRIKVEIMQSTVFSQHFALMIDDTRYGIDAGPWKTVDIATISVKELEEIMAANRDGDGWVTSKG